MLPELPYIVVLEPVIAATPVIAAVDAVAVIAPALSVEPLIEVDPVTLVAVMLVIFPVAPYTLLPDILVLPVTSVAVK
jgi:hypothetical protein